MSCRSELRTLIDDRDCTANNIMFDPTGMFPDLYHPVKIHRNQQLTGAAKHATRTAKPPRYYLIDFGLAQAYDCSRGMPLADPILGGDKSVPEFRRSMGGPYNPFSTDVYYIGNVVRTRLLDVSSRILSYATRALMRTLS